MAIKDQGCETRVYLGCGILKPMQPTPAVSSFAAMIEMLFGSWISISLAAAAKFGVADQLESGPKTTKDLAAVLKLHEESLYRVLRALAGVGVFHEDENS